MNSQGPTTLRIEITRGSCLHHVILTRSVLSVIRHNLKTGFLTARCLLSGDYTCRHASEHWSVSEICIRELIKHRQTKVELWDALLFNNFICFYWFKKIVLWTERGMEGLPMQKTKKKKKERKKWEPKWNVKLSLSLRKLSSMFDFFLIFSYSCSYWCLYLGLLQWLDGR